MRIVYVLSVLFGALSGLGILHAQQNAGVGGAVTGGNVTMLDQELEAAIAYARFEPGARTRWHTHEGGQIILVEEGVARTQVRGGPVIELKVGETTYVGPGLSHWHGAAPDRGGVQYNISRGGTTFTDEVTDEEYRVAPQR